MRRPAEEPSAFILGTCFEDGSQIRDPKTHAEEPASSQGHAEVLLGASFSGAACGSGLLKATFGLYGQGSVVLILRFGKTFFFLHGCA